MKEELITQKHGPVASLIVWARTTVYMIGLTATLAAVYICFMFHPIADVSMIHCANLIAEEVRLSEWEATLRLREAELKNK